MLVISPDALQHITEASQKRLSARDHLKYAGFKHRAHFKIKYPVKAHNHISPQNRKPFNCVLAIVSPSCFNQNQKNILLTQHTDPHVVWFYYSNLTLKEVFVLFCFFCQKYSHRTTQMVQQSVPFHTHETKCLIRLNSEHNVHSVRRLRLLSVVCTALSSKTRPTWVKYSDSSETLQRTDENCDTADKAVPIEIRQKDISD